VPKKIPPELLEYFRKQGARGGKSAAKSRTPEERSEVARKAAQARWAKKKDELAK